jgi:hypothetical protein
MTTNTGLLFIFLGLVISGLGLGLQIKDLDHPWFILSGFGMAIQLCPLLFIK